MNKILMRFIACLAFAFPWAVSAAPAITTAACTVNPGTCATGITGLVTVGATAYDVAFDYTGSYNTIYAGNPAPTLASPTDAYNVASAILTSLSASTVNGVVANAGYTDYFFVPYKLHGPSDSNPGYVDFMYGYKSGSTWGGIGDCSGGLGCFDAAIDYGLHAPDFAYNWVVFTATGPANTGEVPEPATLALLGLGLAGLGFARRKKQKAA